MGEFRTSEHQIQLENGVTQLLINNVAGYTESDPLKNPAKEGLDVYAWTKATSEWKLVCEASGFPRADAIKFYNIKFAPNRSLMTRMVSIAENYYGLAVGVAIGILPCMVCDIHYYCILFFRVCVLVMCPIMIQWSKLIRKDLNSD
jgi:hypothetical protein